MTTSATRTNNFTAGVIGGLMLAASEPALAWDGMVSGTIHVIEVTQGNNFAFRVHLKDVSAACNGGPSWAYLNETDSNYKTYVATLLTAKAQGNAVVIYSNLDNGYCRIGHIFVL